LYTTAIKRKKADFVIGTYQVLKNFIAYPGIKEQRLKIKDTYKNEDFSEVLEYLE
jgi:hypothetical protein